MTRLRSDGGVVVSTGDAETERVLRGYGYQGEKSGADKSEQAAPAKKAAAKKSSK